MRIGPERRRSDRQRRQYMVTVHIFGGMRVFDGRVMNISRSGIRLKGLAITDDLVVGTKVSVRIVVENPDPLAAAEVVKMTGKIRRTRADYNHLDIAIAFDSPFPLDEGGARQWFKKLVASCFTERPRY